MIDKSLSESELEELMYSIIDEFNENFKPVTEKEFVDERRWVSMWKRVFNHIPSNRFLEITWDEGKTEYQDDSEPNFYWREVQPKTKTITVYE